jgi:hypothetical protein
MKRLAINLALALLLSHITLAQTQMKEYDSFKKEHELKTAFLKFDMTAFAQDNVVFVCDTIERQVKPSELNELMKTHVRIPRNTQIKKASETNNGWVQTFGIYKDDDAIMYIRFTINPDTEKLEEVNVEKNN